MWARVTAGEALGGIRFTMHSRQGQKARDVRQWVWVKRTSVADRRGGRVDVTCLVAREEGVPAGVKPVEWRLLTNRRVETFEAATQLIDWYRARVGSRTITGYFSEQMRFFSVPLFHGIHGASVTESFLG